MARAMILAAGFGTRLRPLTDELPKPLVWVGDRPALAHVAERLVAAGIGDIVVNTHHHAEAFSPELLELVPGRIMLSTEREILGTGGGVANAASLLGEGDVVVWNGDILAPLDVTALLAAHARGLPPTGGPPGGRGATVAVAGETKGDSMVGRPGTTMAIAPKVKGEGTDGRVGATMAIAPKVKGEGMDGRVGATMAIAPKVKGEGTVGLGERGQVVRLRGERFGEEVAGGDFLGVSVLCAELRRTLPAPGCLVGDGLLPWLRSGGEVAAFATSVRWDDIGSVEAYLRANQRWLASTGRPAFVGEGASVAAGVEVTGSVVGRGAVVSGIGRLMGCVVWPGARVTAPLANAVVTTAGRRVSVTLG